LKKKNISKFEIAIIIVLLFCSQLSILPYLSLASVDGELLDKETVTVVKGGDDFNIISGIKTFKENLNKDIQYEVLSSLDFSDISDTLVIFSHGFKEGIVINGDLISWADLIELIYSSKANKIYLACCYGANIYKHIKNSEKVIYGWRGITDAILLAQTIGYFINYEFEHIDDAKKNLDNLESRINLLSQHPELTVPLLHVLIQDASSFLWFSFKFHLLFNEFEIPKVEAMADFGLSVIFDQFLEEVVGQILSLAITLWIDIFLFALFINILIFRFAFAKSKESFGGTAAWVTFEAVAFPPIGLWCQGRNPSGGIEFTMYCPPTLISPQLYAIYGLFVWFYVNYPELRWWYEIDTGLANVEVEPFPGEISVVPCSTEQIWLNVTNVGAIPANYDIVVNGLPEAYYTIPSSVYIPAGETRNICLQLHIPCDASPYETYNFYIQIIYKPCPVQIAVLAQIDSSLHVGDKTAPEFEIFDKIIYDNETFEYSADILDSAGADTVSAFLYYKGALVEQNHNPLVTIIDGAKRYTFTFQKPAQLGDYDISIRAYCPLGNFGSRNAIIHYLDDDEIGPEIIITPITQNVTDGDSTISFNVDVTDPSDISSLYIKFNNTIIGTTPGTYVIENPKKLGLYPIFVEATDNDIDRGEIDKAVKIEFASVNILDDDTTPPNIAINYFGSQNDGDPGIWEVVVEDPESGFYELNVTIDDFLVGHNTGNYYVPNSLGLHMIIVNASNADLDRGIIDQEYGFLFSSVFIVDDDTDAPIISDFLITDNIHNVIIDFDALDDSSGDDQGISKIVVCIDGVFEETYYADPDQTSFNIIIPNHWIMELGTHTVKVEVWDADDDRISDSMFSIAQGEFEITFLEMLEFVIWEIEQLIDKIQSSPDNCCKNKNSNNTMSNKLCALISLITNGELNGGYNKLLHDIKPKLTGLKTDENGIPWGNGVFKNPWVTCGALQEEFRTDCNEILKHIQILLSIT
jgi:hypothetical protein